MCICKLCLLTVSKAHVSSAAIVYRERRHFPNPNLIHPDTDAKYCLTICMSLSVYLSARVSEKTTCPSFIRFLRIILVVAQSSSDKQRQCNSFLLPFLDDVRHWRRCSAYAQTNSSYGGAKSDVYDCALLAGLLSVSKNTADLIAFHPTTAYRL